MIECNTEILSLDLTRVRNANLLGGFATATANSFNLLHHIHAIRNLAENNVLAIQPRCLDCGDKELRSLCIWTRIRHGQISGLCVLDFKVLIVEFATVDGFTTSAGTVSEVTTLD